MLNSKEFLREEKDCAAMLGMTLEEYRSYVKNTKVPDRKVNSSKKNKNDILSKLGLTTKDLKTRKV